MSLVCLNYFSYQRAEATPQATVYHNCTILKPFGDYQPGQVIDSIIIQASFHIWQAGDYVDEVNITL